MESWNGEFNDNFVEAIEEGKIVRVTKDYAKKEGLLIIKRQISKKKETKDKKEEEERITLEDLRKPLNWKKNQVVSELLENFHWLISKKRKERNLTRRQLSKEINESKNNIKLVENGILPKNDFIIINKIQSFLNINLRKDKKDFVQSPRSLIKNDDISDDKLERKNSKIDGDIEIIE